MPDIKISIALCWILPFLLLPYSIYSQTKNAFETATTFRCEFPDGITSNWDNGKLSLNKARMRSNVVFISKINKQVHSAVMTGNIGKGPVSLVIGNKVIHFTEVTPTGDFTVMTLFNKPLSHFDFPAVWSRHVMKLGGPVVSQYYGICRRMD